MKRAAGLWLDLWWRQHTYSTKEKLKSLDWMIQKN